MKSNIKYVYFVSLGCSKNFVDTEVMAAALIKHGFGITDDEKYASIFVVNTCAFIPPARQEAEDNISDAIKWKKKNSDRKLVVTGCLTQWDKKEEYSNKYSEVDLWLGINELTSLPEKIAALYGDKEKNKSKFFCKRTPSYLYDEKTPRLQLTPAHYAFIKIADGCDNKCTYCSIPSIRGTLRSRNAESVLLEAKNLVAGGVKELIIIAQDITAFARDRKDNKDNLAGLVAKLDKIQGNHWIRLHYLHPEGITDDLISILKNSEYVIPYLDIPIQHISDNILKQMNRKVTQKEVLNILEKLRQNIPRLITRTTFLTGFPGEAEKDFNDLRNFVKEWKIERLGVFPFYPEPGTKAAAMDKQVPFEIAKQRADELQSIHTENSLNFNSKLVDKEFNVIIDSMSGSSVTGRTYMDSPDIDNTVTISGAKNLRVGEFVCVRINNFTAFELKGKLINSPAK